MRRYDVQKCHFGLMQYGFLTGILYQVRCRWRQVCWNEYMGEVHDGSSPRLRRRRAPSLTGALPLPPYRVHGTGYTPNAAILAGNTSFSNNSSRQDNSIYLCLLKDTSCRGIMICEGRDKMQQDALDRIVEEWHQV